MEWLTHNVSLNPPFFSLKLITCDQTSTSKITTNHYLDEHCLYELRFWQVKKQFTYRTPLSSFPPKSDLNLDKLLCSEHLVTADDFKGTARFPL